MNFKYGIYISSRQKSCSWELFVEFIVGFCGSLDSSGGSSFVFFVGGGG